jgi:hypothetical protein
LASRCRSRRSWESSVSTRLQGKIQSWLGELSLAILGTGDKKLDEFNAKIRELKGQLTALQGLSSVLMGGAEGGERFDKIKSDLAEVIKQRQIYLDQQKVSAKVAEEAAAKESAAVQAQIEAAKAKLEAERTAEEGAKKAAAAAERRAAEAKQAAEAAKRAAEEQQRLDKSAAEERFEIEQQILKASGQGSEAKLRALDAELAKQREILALATGGVTEQDEAAIARVRSIEASRIKFEELSTQAGRSLEDLARVRTRIEQDVELGILSQYQGQQQLLAIEQERLQVLRDLAAQATAAAEASGDPEAIAAAEALNDQIRQVEVSVLHASDSFATLREGAEEALHGGLTDVLSNLQEFESVGDVFRSLASTVAGSLQRMASEMLATYIMTQLLKSAMGAFGGGGGGSGAALASRGIGPMKRGGLIGYAGGGAIDATPGGVLRGPGTGTSDSIAAITTTGKPLLVSSGEYVVRAAVVNRPGMLALLHDLNAGIIASRAELRRPPRYASGGVIEAASAAGIGASTPAAKQAGFAGVVGLEPGLVMKHLETEDFDRFLVRKLQRNSRALKSIVGG